MLRSLFLERLTRIALPEQNGEILLVAFFFADSGAFFLDHFDASLWTHIEEAMRLLTHRLIFFH